MLIASLIELPIAKRRMWQKHNVQLANFDLASLRVIWFRWGSHVGDSTKHSFFGAFQEISRRLEIALFTVGVRSIDEPTPNVFANRLATLRNNFRVSATTPWISSRCPASLVRLKLFRCPHSLAHPLVVLPSMSFDPPLHSLGSRTPAAMLFKHKPGLISFSLGHPARPKDSGSQLAGRRG